MLLRNLNVLNRIYKDEFLVFFSIPAISLTLILTNLYSAEPMFTSSNDKFSINICKKLTNAGNCTEITPEQPTKLEMKFIGKIHDKGPKDFTFKMYGNTQETVLIDGIPFANYWQLKKRDAYVFHPMIWGRYIFNNSHNESFIQDFDLKLSKTSKILSDGGMVFYYPNLYPLNRMRGPDIMYSAISQSEILAGFLKLESELKTKKSSKLTQSVLKGLLFPHEQGGVNLDNLAFLEFPMFRSNPEIILNGWLHAILHLNDLALATNNEEIVFLVHKNMNFFAKNHASWYDEKRNISNYSDTSPIRTIFDGSVNKQSIRVLYRGEAKGLKNYIFEPVEDLDNAYSSFDTRVISRRGKLLTIGLNRSTLFDTLIVSDLPFRMKLKNHAYDDLRATPSTVGDWITVNSSKIRDGIHVFDMADFEGTHIYGNPTNFAKINGKNFYHGQHIVALTYLAKFGAFEDNELKENLRSIALSWLKKTKHYKSRDLIDFEPLQNVLDSINQGKYYQQAQTIKDLDLHDYDRLD